MTNIVNYPANPTIGQEFEVGTTTKIWDGEKWANKSTGHHERRIGELEESRVKHSQLWGDRYKGELTADAGVTLADEFSVLLYEGNYYSYIGSDPFPVIVASGTVPAAPDYNIESLFIAKKSSKGTINSFTYTQNPEFNSISKEADAANVFGGTPSQPNRIGRKVFVGEYPSTANTSPISIPVGFIVNNQATSGFQTVKVFHIREDGEFLDLSLTSDYTISGYGTDTLTLTPVTTLPIGSSYWVRCIGDEDVTGDTPWLTTIAGGYDNINNKLMSAIQGAHCTIMGSTDHATVTGGSYVTLNDAGSYVTAGGTGIRINGLSTGAVAFGKAIEITESVGGVAIGTRLKQQGNYGSIFGFNNSNGQNSFTAGSSNKNLTTASFVTGEQNENNANQSFVTGFQCENSGIWSFVVGFQNSNTASSSVVTGYKNSNTKEYSHVTGRENSSNHRYSNISGYGSVSRGAGTYVGAGLVGGEGGKLQSGRIILQQLTTDGSEGQLRDANNISGITMGVNSAVTISGKCVAFNTDGSEAASFSINALARVGTGTATIVAGANGTLENSEAGSAGWSLRLQALGTRTILARPTGEVGKNIQWVCELEFVEAGY